PLPGPFPFPFIGTIFQIGLNPRKWAENNLSDSIDIWELYVGPFRIIVPCNAKYLDKIYLSRDVSSLSKESKFFKRGIAAYDEIGLLNAIAFNNNFHKWKRSRQFVTKVLMSKKYHIGFINRSQKIFKEFEEQWDKNDVTILDFSKWVSRYKTKVTFDTVIGQPLYNLSSFDSLSKAASEYIAMFIFSVFVPKIISKIFMFFGFNAMKKDSVFLNGTIRSIIQKRRDEIRNGSTTNFNLLDLLLITNLSNDSEEYIEDEQSLNDEEIEGNLVEITAASIEMTKNALSFLVYNVAKNPLILEKLRAEILKVFGSDTNLMITYEALENCRYLDALVKELLRHSNPGPYNLRVLDSYEYVGNYHFSPGTWFWLDHHRIMNDSNNWKEPTEFNPDRFLSEENAYPFDFNGNWDDYLVKNPVCFRNNLQNEVSELAIFAARIMSIPPISAESERFWSLITNIHSQQYHRLTNECATKMTCIQWHIGQEKNLNATNSNETWFEKIVSNVKFDDMNNIDNNLEQFEEENVMQISINIGNFYTNDQITYNEAIIEYSIQAT
ncbi:37423_t:CDS:2, partial [Gigaspora margarita]